MSPPDREPGPDGHHAPPHEAEPGPAGVASGGPSGGGAGLGRLRPALRTPLQTARRVTRRLAGSRAPDAAGIRLRYTGSLTRREFEAACRRQAHWYHSYYFDNGFEVRGHYNIGPDAHSYGFPDELEGLSVLDIGTGGGWFAHYLHQRGARVTATDLRGLEDYDVYGTAPDALASPEPRPPDRHDAAGRPIYLSPVSGAFFLMNDILGSEIPFRNATVYEIAPDLFDGEQFDLVFIGALLVHVRDPIGALRAARRVCRGRLIASTNVDLWDESSTPTAQMAWANAGGIGWWLPNVACFREWFLAAGFRDVDVSRHVKLSPDLPDPQWEGGVQIHGVAHASV